MSDEQLTDELVGSIGQEDETSVGQRVIAMKMTATVELEFESAGETTLNAMDAALIRGLEALKGSIELGARESVS